MRQGQRGITFIGMVFVGILVAVIGILTAKVVPTYLEYQIIMKATQRASASGTTPGEIRSAFDRAKAVDFFEAISGNDLQISRVNDRLVVEFAYAKEIHLAGPAYLVLKYQGSTR
jgi:hypothetical protein